MTLRLIVIQKIGIGSDRTQNRSKKLAKIVVRSDRVHPWSEPKQEQDTVIKIKYMFYHQTIKIL